MKLKRKAGFRAQDRELGAARPWSEPVRRVRVKSPIQRVLAAALAVLALAAAGCGYRLSGTGEALPADVRTVFIEPFVNRSREIAIHRDVTAALRSEFYRRGRLRVVDRLEEADAVLSGIVYSLESTVVAVNRRDEALLYEMALVVDVNLRRRAPDQVLWAAKRARFMERYSGSRGAVVISSSDFKRGTLNPEDVRDFTDVQLTEALAGVSKEHLVEGFARQIYRHLVEMF